MAIDIRATVTCSLGTLISGSISDDYLQGSGLVKTKGSCEISALITPAVGTVVTFDYVKGGVTRAIPRKLRVLSSFADPFRRTTKVELGCKLTYLSDLKEAINWDAFDDPENAGLTEADAEIITLPIRASSVMSKCLTELGITASSSPLTNRFSVAEFDFGPGYVQVLGDLLVSESYFGYLNFSEVLQVVSLDQAGGTGPVFTSADIVDLGPIGVGQLPGEAVTVSYSTLKLNGDTINEDALLDWETTESSSTSKVVISYTDGAGAQAFKEFNTLEKTLESTNYSPIETPTGEILNKVVSRLTQLETSSVSVLGGLPSDYLNNGISFNSEQITKTTSEFFYYDAYGNEFLRIKDTTGSIGFFLGTLGIAFAFAADDYYNPVLATSVALEYEIVRTETIGNYQKVATEIYGPWVETLSGQQAVATGGQGIASAADVTAFVNEFLPTSGGLGNRGLFLLSSSVRTERRTEGQAAPTTADIINAANANGEANPDNGWRTESSAELELALGSATAQRRIEFSLPYAPDDRFVKSGGSPATYYAVASDAPEKANRYGRVQNRLLLGNRSGVNLQVAPEKLPVAPFAPLYLQADGLTALYRANGNQWAFDSNGIVCSTDALFWAAVSGTGTFWFPVAPGVTTLPAEPAIVDGEMNATTIVLPYNETASYDARLRVGMVVSKFDYALEVLTEVPAFTVTVGAGVDRYTLVYVPATDIALAAAAPVVTSSTAVRIPAAVDIAIAAPVPTVGSGIGSFVSVPAAAITIAAVAPTTTTNGVDGDAAAYIAAVESADGQSLEEGVKSAINSFVLGCKADGIWTAIKASCILAGARTLTGALVPLVGPAPTNVGGLFVSGDYDRETGLLGDGSTKYLDSNRNNNADPQNSQHLSVFISVQSTGAANCNFIAAGDFLTAGSSSLQTVSSNANMFARSRNSSGATYTAKVTGFFGKSRSTSASFSYRFSSATATTSSTSQTPTNDNVFVFRGNAATPAHSNARLAFYSIGESLDLALLDTRVTALIDAIAAAIP